MPRNTFNGFDDWIEIFRSGEHTDNAGTTRTWTEQDLDEIVANHSADRPAPAVVGHPKTDDPAWGWTAALKREGASLYAKFKDVAKEFADAVEAGRYRNRSVKIGKTADGYRLIHVGWLGAAPPAYLGVDSRELLRAVVGELVAGGFSVVNVDSTVVAQRPRLAPYIPAMRERIAQDCAVEVSRVNVKATTTEGMGFTGRGEGIAAHAVVLLGKAG